MPTSIVVDLILHGIQKISLYLVTLRSIWHILKQFVLSELPHHTTKLKLPSLPIDGSTPKVEYHFLWQIKFIQDVVFCSSFCHNTQAI